MLEVRVEIRCSRTLFIGLRDWLLLFDNDFCYVSLSSEFVELLSRVALVEYPTWKPNRVAFLNQHYIFTGEQLFF